MIVNIQGLNYSVTVLDAKPEFEAGILWEPGPEGSTVCMRDYGPDTASRKTTLTLYVPGLIEGRAFAQHLQARNQFANPVTITPGTGEEIFGPHIQHGTAISGYLYETEIIQNRAEGLATTGVTIAAEFRPEAGVGSFLYTVTPGLPPAGRVYIQSVKRNLADKPGLFTKGTGETSGISQGLPMVDGATVSIVCHRDDAAPLLAYLELARGTSFAWPYDWANSWLFTPGSGGTNPSVVVLDVLSEGPADSAGTFQGLTVTLGRAL